MGLVKQYIPEKLVIGLLGSSRELIEESADKCCEKWGECDYRSGIREFTYTDYYNKEMGTPLFRLFLSFRELVSPDILTEIKEWSNEVELEYSVDSKRKINLDPGIMALSRFVLATTKESAHRIALKHGMWAEITLTFQGGEFQPLPWTYPDFRSDENRAILKEIRTIYKENLKQG